MNLSRPLKNAILFEGKKYRLHLAFDNVLRVFDVQREEIFSPEQRLQLSVELLAGKKAGRLPFKNLNALYQQIKDEFLNSKTRPVKPGEPRVLDFIQDAPLIYAAFLQAYGIDLTQQKGRLDWRYFIALFQGLPESTKMREVMSIRRRELPAPNEHNRKEIAALMEAKAYYAIKISEEEAEASFQADVNRVAESLINRAKGGVKRGRR